MSDKYEDALCSFCGGKVVDGNYLEDGTGFCESCGADKQEIEKHAALRADLAEANRAVERLLAVKDADAKGYEVELREARELLEGAQGWYWGMEISDEEDEKLANRVTKWLDAHPETETKP